MFLFRLSFWLLLLKLFALAFVGMMAVMQIPELRYDYGAVTPVAIESPEELQRLAPRKATFVAVTGRPDFERAFVYKRYGLAYTYFTAKPYGPLLVVRTHEAVDDNWKEIGTLVGRLRPFEDQPFSYRIRDIYRDQVGLEVPAEAYFLALHDVPRPSGWQIGAVAIAGTAWLAMLYGFFLHRRFTGKR